MIVVIAGDVTAERVREALQKRLGDWPRNPDGRPDPVLPDLPLQAAPALGVEIPVPDKSQTSIVWGHAGRAPPAATPTSTPPRS